VVQEGEEDEHEEEEEEEKEKEEKVEKKEKEKGKEEKEEEEEQKHEEHGSHDEEDEMVEEVEDDEDEDEEDEEWPRPDGVVESKHALDIVMARTHTVLFSLLSLWLTTHADSGGGRGGGGVQHLRSAAQRGAAQQARLRRDPQPQRLRTSGLGSREAFVLRST
jgi:hypothetical protein